MAQRIRPSSSKRLFRFATRDREDVRSDVEEEFAFHIDCRIDDLRARGVTETAAREQALKEFGDRWRGADGMHQQRSRPWNDRKSSPGLGASCGRMRSSAPGSSAAVLASRLIAILTLALAIGGNAAIFSIVNALALKDLPVTRPEQIVRVYTGQSLTSWPNYLDFAERRDVFSDLAARTNSALSLSNWRAVRAAGG